MKSYNKFIAAFLVTFFLLTVQPALSKTKDVLWQWRQDEVSNHPGFIHPTGDDTLLVVKNGYLDPQVIELDNQGQVIWESGTIQANSVHPLENGNLLIAVSGFPGSPHVPAVVEMDREGEVLWKYTLPHRAYTPRYALRLSNGNTVITTPLKILEIEPSGKITWEYSGELLNAVEAVRLDNGNTLITDKGITLGGKVIEVNPEKKVIWDTGTLENLSLKKPMSSQKLDSEKIRIVDLGTSRVIDVKRDGTILRVLNWRETVAANWIGNQWYCFSKGDEVFLSASYTNNKSTIMRIKPDSFSVVTEAELKDWNILLKNEELMFFAADVLKFSGMQLRWEGEENTLIAFSDEKKIELTVGEKKVTVNNSSLNLDVAPMVQENKVLVPLQFLRDVLNWQVEVNNDAHLIMIETRIK